MRKVTRRSNLTHEGVMMIEHRTPRVRWKAPPYVGPDTLVSDARAANEVRNEYAVHRVALISPSLFGQAARREGKGKASAGVGTRRVGRAFG